VRTSPTSGVVLDEEALGRSTPQGALVLAVELGDSGLGVGLAMGQHGPPTALSEVGLTLGQYGRATRADIPRQEEAPASCECLSF